MIRATIMNGRHKFKYYRNKKKKKKKTLEFGIFVNRLKKDSPLQTCKNSDINAYIAERKRKWMILFILWDNHINGLDKHVVGDFFE